MRQNNVKSFLTNVACFFLSENVIAKLYAIFANFREVSAPKPFLRSAVWKKIISIFPRAFLANLSCLLSNILYGIFLIGLYRTKLWFKQAKKTDANFIGQITKFSIIIYDLYKTNYCINSPKTKDLKTCFKKFP